MPLPKLAPRLVRLARANEWWAYKFSPLLATAYATAWVTGASAWALLPRLLLLLLALTIGATYVSLINDWTDRTDDAASGKPNPQAGRSGTWLALAVGGCVLPGLGFGWYIWRLSPLAGGLYLGAWVVYSLYSLPPFRLKKRGLAGVLADAAGAHFFPQLLAAVLVGTWAGRPLPGGWLAAVGTWALACGVRNILAHQLGDAAHDARGGVPTFVLRHGVGFAEKLSRRGVFPVEVLAFGALLGLSRAGLPWALLGLYAGLEWFRHRVWSVRLTPTTQQPYQALLLNEYYEVFYPLAFLLLQSQHYPADSLLLAGHALLFGPHFWRTGRALTQAGAVVAHKAGARWAR